MGTRRGALESDERVPALRGAKVVCVACGDGPAARACGGEGRDPMVVERLFFGIIRKAVVCFTRLSEVLCMYMEVPIPK